MNEANAEKRRRRLFLSGIVAIVLLVLLLVGIILYRHVEERREAEKLREQARAGQRVNVVTVVRSPPHRILGLSGEARPYATATIYAKVSGYLKKIPVDKGDRVKRGQLLAVIEAPELDRQYDGAVADAANKRLLAGRTRTLLGTGSIAPQEHDTNEAAARVAEATAASLKTQKGYKVIRAPFAATVTARFADPGALVQTAASSQPSALPLVNLSQTDRLRIYVYLDQSNAAFVRVGDRGEVADAARPEVRIPARVSRISGELDPKTRTMLVEFDLDNRSGAIVPGGFVQVNLTIPTSASVEIPAEALLVKGEKEMVAVVGSDNRVNFRPVTIAGSDGKTVRVSNGLNEGERVVLHPGTGLAEGNLVQPVPVERR